MKVKAFIAALLLSPLNAVAADDFLGSKLDSFGVRQGVDHLWPLCQKIDRPCGLEELEVNDPSLSAPSGGTTIMGQTVRDVLDHITTRAPKYQWAVRKGVINIEPKDRGTENPLDRKLAKVTLKNMSSTRAALHVLQLANALGSFQPPGNFRLRKIHDLELENVTVREALNAIVAADGQAMWVVFPRNKDKPSLFFGLWGSSGLKGADHDAERKRIWEEWRTSQVR